MAVTPAVRTTSGPAPGLQRIELPCAVFGVSKPPTDVEARLLQAGNTWTLLVADGGSSLEPLKRWLNDCGAVDVRGDSANGRAALRARFDHLPLQWAQLGAVGDIESLRFLTDGRAILTVRASPDAAAAAARLLRVGPRVRSDNVRLTPRQAELLRHCVDRGYYNIPRRMTLRELGTEIGISATSLSLALRRAEAKIILAFAAEAKGRDGDDGKDH
jgi:hypothetical protein